MAVRGRSWLLTLLVAMGLGLPGSVFVAPSAWASVVTGVQTTWGTDGRVLAIATDPVTGKVYVGGSFSAVTDNAGNVQATVANLAVFDPATGKFNTLWHPNPNGEVDALAVANGRLFVGGDFTKVGGQSHARLASIDLTTGNVQSWSPRASGGKVQALAVNGGWVYAGGNFTSLGGASISYLGRLDASSGAVDSNWVPRPNARVQTLVAASTRVYAGGDFTTVLGSSRAHSIASINTTTPASLTSGFAAGATNEGNKPPALDLAVDGSYLLAAVSGQGGACAALNSSTGNVVWSDHANGNLQAVTATGGTVYCGGHFGGVGSFEGQNRYKLAAVDETTGNVLSFAPRINSPLGVWALGVSSGRLYVGGDFTKINRKLQYHFAQFN